jgi:hypothetical protein
VTVTRITDNAQSENDNRSIRDLQFAQAFALELYVSLWSGDKRKMEIAESFLQPLVTVNTIPLCIAPWPPANVLKMMRRGGRFKRQRDVETKPSLQDNDSELERKWMTWVELESYRR